MPSVPLSAPEMKIAGSALSVLLEDLGHDESEELEIPRRVLDKHSDEHSRAFASMRSGYATGPGSMTARETLVIGRT